MNVNFEYSKTLACEGSILMWLCFIPYAGPILAIIGLVLLLRSLKEFSGYYQDEKIYSEALRGIKYYVVAIVAVAIATGAMVAGAWSATHFTDVFIFTAGFGVGLIAFLAGLVIAFVFFLLAANHLKTTFNALADHSGEQLFRTAGTLLWIGSILAIILVGWLIILVSWIIVTIGFFTMKSRQYQQYNAQNNTCTPTTPPTQANAINQNGVQV
ncbi:MAG: DUF996 domain-containing protein [Candidatus Bathyarchaeia archaeon]|jgi:uncharacterized membrane protein